MNEFDPEDAAATIHDVGETVRRREVERALDELGAHGEVTASQRRVVEAMADRVVERLLSVPAEHLESTDDENAHEAAMRLFGRE